MSHGFIWYFAYGSNMNPVSMKHRGIYIIKREIVVLPQWELKFNKIADLKRGTGYANIEANSKEWVEGIAYLIPSLDLYKLDFFEGYPKHYGRIELEVIHSIKGTPMRVISYKAKPDMTKDGLLPTIGYMRHLYAGAVYLSKKYQIKLRKQPVLNDVGFSI